MSAVLGSGSFGTVYLGRDPATGSAVAVKVFDRVRRDDAVFMAALRAEADAMRRIDDPHCVQVRDVIDEPTVAAIVTELIDGASLRAVLGRAGRLTGPQALDVMRGALRGLIAVHEAGLVHGDIKPDNILVDRRGVSRLIDFGLARDARSARWAGGSVTGSPSYMSPEQITGGAVDGRSDLYACAAVLFELLTGRRPYTGDDAAQVLRKHLHDPVPDPREVDPELGDALARVCLTGLAKDPTGRFRSAADFLAALQDAAADRYGAAWRTGLGLGALAGAATGVLTAHAPENTIPTGAADPTDRLGAAAAVPVRAAGRLSRRSRVGSVAVAVLTVTVVVILIVLIRTVSGHNTDRGGAAPAPGTATTAPAAVLPGGSGTGSLPGTSATATGPTATPGPTPAPGPTAGTGTGPGPVGPQFQLQPSDVVVIAVTGAQGAGVGGGFFVITSITPCPPGSGAVVVTIDMPDNPFGAQKTVDATGSWTVTGLVHVPFTPGTYLVTANCLTGSGSTPPGPLATQPSSTAGIAMTYTPQSITIH